ncbi:hypothetical protein Q0M94_23235 (plasmid) [Deinococcus radiomollis]
MPVVDGHPSQFSHQVHLVWADRAVQLYTLKAGQLQHGRTDAARRAMDERPVSRLQVGRPVHKLKGCGVVQDGADHVGGCQADWDWDQVGFGQADELLVSAGDRQTCNQVAHLEPAGPRTEGFDHAGEIIAGCNWIARRRSTDALTQHDVPEGDTRCQNANLDMGTLRRRVLFFNPFEDLRTARSLHHDPLIHSDRLSSRSDDPEPPGAVEEPAETCGQSDHSDVTSLDNPYCMIQFL